MRSNMLDLIPNELKNVLQEAAELRQAYLVGGCVRDWLLGHQPKDFDVEVYGVSYDELAAGLSRWGRTDLVGRSFGVLKVTFRPGQTFDFSIPRRDSKVAPGHKGFAVAFDPAITPETAAARRDFTINALMFDPRSGQVLDFFGGRADLKNHILRHPSAAFAEDPLRVLRGMQFAARFGLHAAPETIDLCRRIKTGYRELAVERVREEWFKWAAQGTVPSAGLRFLADTEWIEHFPEVQALIGVPQEPEWHPEGDVFVHTCHGCDALAKLPEWQQADEESRIIYMLAVLAHDFGKPSCTQEALKNGRQRIVSPGHDEAGVALAASFLQRINAPTAIQERVPPLVANHMAHLNPITDRYVRRLAKRLEPASIDGLCLVIIADSSGRPPLPAHVPEVVTVLQAKAAELQVQAAAPRPILLGRHLIELGMTPGKVFGAILHDAFEAQLEGYFTDLAGAWQWLSEQTSHPVPPEARQHLQTQIQSASQSGNPA